MVIKNKGTNAYTIRNFRCVKKVYTCELHVTFASALFVYPEAVLYDMLFQS